MIQCIIFKFRKWHTCNYEWYRLYRSYENCRRPGVAILDMQMSKVPIISGYVKSSSKPPWTPYHGFTLDPLGALSGPLTTRRNYAYTSICSSYALDPFVHPNTISIYGKCDVLLSSCVLNLYYLLFIVKKSYLWVDRFQIEIIKLFILVQFMIWKRFIFFFHSFIFILALYIGKDYVTSMYIYSSPFIVLFLCVYCLIDRCLRQETICPHFFYA